MKADIHPNYKETEISCACGAVYHTRSTKQDIKIGICAACHPFFTGEQKFVDTAGRVEKFARRYGSTKATRALRKPAALHTDHCDSDRSRSTPLCYGALRSAMSRRRPR